MDTSGRTVAKSNIKTTKPQAVVPASQPVLDLAPEPQRPLLSGVRLGVCLFVALMCILVVWANPRPTGDLYVGLAAGRDIMNGQLGQPDDWSYMTHGEVWVNQNWGTHLLFYFSNYMAGDWGIALSKGMMMLLLAGVIIGSGRLRGSDWAVAILAAGAAIAAGRSYIDMRPNLTSLTFAPATMFLVFLTRRKPHLFWLVGAWVYLWSNMHGGFIFGLGMMGLWSFCQLLSVMFEEGVWLALLRKPIAMVAGIAAIVLGVAHFVFFHAAADAEAPTDAANPLSHWAIASFLGVLGIVILTLAAVARGRKSGPLEAKDLGKALLRVVSRVWPLFAATLVAFLLTVLLSPFKWTNITHPFVVARIQSWRTVAEWRPLWFYEAYGSAGEFFVVMGVTALLMVSRIIVEVGVRKKVVVEHFGMAAFSLASVLIIFLAVTDVPPTMRNYPPAVAYIGTLETTQVCFGALMLLVLAAVIVLTMFARRMERPTAVQISQVIFETFLATMVVYMAVNSRRFCPLACLVVAPLLAAQASWALGLRKWIWPTTLAALAILVPVMILGRGVLLNYLPGNPSIPAGSVPQKMWQYHLAFPPKAVEFVNLNDEIRGRVFNEWRWEGFLRWTSPKLSLFMGGRAQQVYDETTFLLRMAVLQGELSPDEASQGYKSLVGPGDANVQVAVLPPPPGQEARAKEVLAEGSPWRAIYKDANTAVYVIPSNPELKGFSDQFEKTKTTCFTSDMAALSVTSYLAAVPLRNPGDAFYNKTIRAKDSPWRLIHKDDKDAVYVIPYTRELQALVTDYEKNKKSRFMNSGLAILGATGTHLAVTPYQDSLRHYTQEDPAETWRVIYFDGRDVVLADAGDAGSARWIEKAMNGQLKYPDVDSAKLSRAMCLMSLPAGTVDAAVLKDAIAQASREKPHIFLYERVFECCSRGKLPVDWLMAFCATEFDRLSSMPVDRDSELECLTCRHALAATAARICQIQKRPEIGMWMQALKAAEADVHQLTEAWGG